MKPNEVSGYKVESISIINSNFSRQEKFSKGNDNDYDVNVDIEVDNDLTKTIARCKLTVNVAVVDRKKSQQIAQSSITGYGIFKMRVNEPNVKIEDFAALNANAIIYPFLREHLANLSLKAGMDVIMLPSVNFVAFLNNRKQAESIND